MSERQHMTPSGLEDLFILDGALVWPPHERPSLRLKESVSSQLFSTTIHLVRVHSVPRSEKENDRSADPES